MGDVYLVYDLHNHGGPPLHDARCRNIECAAVIGLVSEAELMAPLVAQHELAEYILERHETNALEALVAPCVVRRLIDVR